MNNLQKRPSKGILKNASSLDAKLQHQSSIDKDLKWDEDNIAETFHPPGKDYGFMKIEEPKTPFSYANDECNSDHEDHAPEVDPIQLAELLNKAEHPTHDIEMSDVDPIDPKHDSDQFDKLPVDEQVKKMEFLDRRKSHYNEFEMVKLARQMMDEDEDEDEIVDVPGPSTSG